MVDLDIMLRISYNDSINQIKIKNNSTIKDLKYNIQKELKFQIEKQVLIFKGDILQNNKKIDDYNIIENDIIILIIEQNENEKFSDKNKENNIIDDKIFNKNKKIIDLMNQNKIFNIHSNNFNLKNCEIDISDKNKKNIQKTYINNHSQKNNYKTSIQNSKNNLMEKKKKEKKSSSSSKGILNTINNFAKIFKNMISEPEEMYNAFNNPLFQQYVDKEFFTSPQKIKNKNEFKKNQKMKNIVNTISNTFKIFKEINNNQKIEENKDSNNNDEDEDYHNINYRKNNNNIIKVKYENELRQLKEIGFDNKLSIQLLNKYNGNVEKCIEEILKY